MFSSHPITVARLLFCAFYWLEGKATGGNGASSLPTSEGIPSVPVQPHGGLRGQLEAAVLARVDDQRSSRSGESLSSGGLVWSGGGGSGRALFGGLLPLPLPNRFALVTAVFGFSGQGFAVLC